MPGIYLHIPFCEKKCFYCDFYSVETSSNDKLPDKSGQAGMTNDTGKFVDYLIKEIEIKSNVESKLFAEIYFQTVFIGGGTPSLLSPEQMERIVVQLKSKFTITDDAEWTVESNPGSLSLDSLEQYRKLGINRISIGVQSFVPSELKFLQRIHDSNEAKKAILDAKKAGFTNRNVDLIFSIPEQTIESLKISLDTVSELMPEHISCYSLIYEKNTPLYTAFMKNQIQKIDDDLDADLYEFLVNYLLNLGYEQYEVSNFALPGYQCKHNLNYWDVGDYVSFGPSAHGNLNGRRYWNVRSLARYVKLLDEDKPIEEGSEILTVENKINEKVMLGLRSQGINFNQFHKEFGIDLPTLASDIFNDWKINGLCEFDNEQIVLNHKGYFICNMLINQLINKIQTNRKLAS